MPCARHGRDNYVRGEIHIINYIFMYLACAAFGTVRQKVMKVHHWVQPDLGRLWSLLGSLSTGFVAASAPSAAITVSVNSRGLTPELS